jgi:predicted DNA-binding transcriptional regulator AlpA
MGTLEQHRVLPLPTVRLLSRPEAATFTGVSPTVFDRMVRDGLMPSPLRVYSRVLWDVRALEASIARLPGNGTSTDSVDTGNSWDEVLR